MKKQLSVICVLFFLLLALSSSRNIGAGSFYHNDVVEDKSEKRNYLVKNNGEKVYGNKVKYQSGMFKKDKIEIDDQEFKIPDIIGYRMSDLYFGRVSNGRYIQRVVHGKINIYYEMVTSTVTSTDGSGRMTNRTQTTAVHYSQVGELNNLVQITNKDDILNLVNGCQASIDMLNKKNKQLVRAVKEDPRYFNKIFDIYNNGCKREKIIY